MELEAARAAMEEQTTRRKALRGEGDGDEEGEGSGEGTAEGREGASGGSGKPSAVGSYNKV